MHFVGLDLAWGERKPHGRRRRRRRRAGSCTSAPRRPTTRASSPRSTPYVAERLRGRHRRAADRDEPDGQPAVRGGAEPRLPRRSRPAPTRPTPASRSSRTDTRGARLADALDLDLDPYSPRPRRALEVYPHAAAVALFRLGSTLKYKDKTGTQIRAAAVRTAAADRPHRGTGDRPTPPLQVAEHDGLAAAASFGRDRDAQERTASRRGSGRRGAVRLRRRSSPSADPTTSPSTATSTPATSSRRRCRAGLTPQPPEPIPAVVRDGHRRVRRAGGPPWSPPPTTICRW